MPTRQEPDGDRLAELACLLAARLAGPHDPATQAVLRVRTASGQEVRVSLGPVQLTAAAVRLGPSTTSGMPRRQPHRLAEQIAGLLRRTGYRLTTTKLLAA